MRKLRKMLAGVLTMTLLAGMMAAPSFADEAKTKGWVHENGVWHFYKEDGEKVAGKEKIIHDKYYAFDTDGAMYEDTLFAAPKSESLMPNRYAFPDGHLAVQNWVKLNADNHMYNIEDARDNKPIYWYYFGKGNADKGTGGQMFFGDEEDHEIHNGVYRFHDNGVMYSGEWYGYNPMSGEKPDNHAAYYQVDGDRAIGKWLYLGDTWYHFNKDGIVDEVWNEQIGSTATGSNAQAPYPEVVSVEPVGATEITVPVGETAELKFQVNLASDSNARSDKFTRKAHDIWGTLTLLGKFTIKGVTEKGICTVEYTPKALGSEDVSLFVDTNEMYSDPITVTASLDNLDTVEAKSNAVNALMESLVDDGSIKADVAETLKNIKTVIQDTEGTDKKELQKQIVNNENYSTLENLYVMKNNITVSVDSSKVQSALGEKGTVSMVGGALNAANPDETVELQVDSAEIPSELKPGNEDTRVVSAFEITMDIGAVPVDGELDFPVKITMTVPTGFDATKAITLYHYHGDEDPTKETLTPKDGKVEFVVDKFSTFAFEQKKEEVKPNPTPSTSDDDDDDDSSSSSRSNSSNSSNSGQWVLDAKGWWYRNGNSSYPANVWSYLEYNNVKDWYRFDQNGYMLTGWFTDTDEKIYYLNPVSNGFRGAMQTGWQLIDGYWYYFNTESDGYKGMLLVNTVTPDGHHVNEAGQRID